MTERLDEVSPIIPHLFVSCYSSSNNERLIYRHQIRAVLTVENEPKPKDVMAMYAEEEIDYMQVPVDDLPNVDISKFFDSTYDFIDKHVSRGENVLVHCMAGISRSVTIVINYLLRQLYARAGERAIIDPEAALDRCLELVRRTRPAARPNTGFMDQLLRAAREYSKSYTKSGLNFISPKGNQPMCDKGFTDASGKPANVICLTNSDFDATGNLVNFKDVGGVVFFNAAWCGHCQHTKPEFIKFANSIPPNAPIRAFSVDAVKEKELVSRINPVAWNYSVRGFPTIVGYYKGKFYSEYAPDPAKPQAFRKAEDFIEYAMGLGTAPVELVKA